MPPHETGSTATPGAPRATAPPPCTFGPQGPTLGDLSDAYLQDYHVRQFRSHSTARGRVAHLTAFFGRAARAATLTTYQIRQYQLARRAAGAATGTINRETSALHRMGTLAVHWGWLDTVPGFPDRLRENPPARASSSTPNTSPSAPTCPPRGRMSSTSPTTPAGASRRSSASPGRKSMGPAVSSGSRPRARRRWSGASSPSRRPSPRPWRDGGRAATPTARWSSTATASPSGAGAPHGAPPARPPGCADPLPPRLPAYGRPQPDPRQRPRARRHAPDRAQEPCHLRPLQHHPRAGTARRRGPARRLSRAAGAGGAGPSAAPRGRPRRAPSPRATRHRVRMRGPPGTGSRRRAWGRRSPDTARPGCRPRSPDEVLEAGPSPPAQRHAHSPAHGVPSRRRSHTRDPTPHSRPHRHGWHQWPAHARESATPGGRVRPWVVRGAAPK